MSELVDNQVDTQNENLKIKIPGLTEVLIEVVMKIEKRIRRKNNSHAKIF